jgi:hypothetical protein
VLLACAEFVDGEANVVTEREHAVLVADKVEPQEAPDDSLGLAALVDADDGDRVSTDHGVENFRRRRGQPRASLRRAGYENSLLIAESAALGDKPMGSADVVHGQACPSEASFQDVYCALRLAGRHL